MKKKITLTLGKIFLLLIISFLLKINPFAQEGWVSQNSGNDSDLSSVYFNDQNNGWVVGRNGTLLRTTDGGKNWITQQTGTTAWLHSIFFLDQNLGWIAGSEFIVTSAVGVVLKTTDGGMNWALDTTELPLSKVFFIDQNIGWAIGNNNEVWPNYYGIIFKTTDGGETWISQAEGPATSIFIDLCFFNETNGWIVGYLNPSPDGIIFKTTDGGLNWVNVPNTFHALTTIRFVGDQYGWILASDDILHTTNGGNDWVLQFNWLNTNGSDIYFVDQYTGWIVSWGGEIQHSSDEGLNWVVQSSGTTNSLTSIYFINNEEGWIVGNQGTILHTTNGGNPPDSPPFNYFPLSPGNKWFFSEVSGDVIRIILEIEKDTILNDGYSYAKLNYYHSDIWGNFILETEGYSYLREDSNKIIGYPDKILIDYNMSIGDTVTSYHPSSYSAVLDTIILRNVFGRYLSTYIFFTTPFDYYSYSDSIGFNTSGDTWYYYSNGLLGCIIDNITYGVVTSVELEIHLPVNSNLEQNYPNPFNPTTTVKFEIPKSSFVNLKIYNLLGREVATLVNEEKPAGSYEVEFNGSDLSSGIYFYKLQTEDYSSVKKMILLK